MGSDRASAEADYIAEAMDEMDDQDLIDILIDRGYKVYDENGELCLHYKEYLKAHWFEQKKAQGFGDEG